MRLPCLGKRTWSGGAQFALRSGGSGLTLRPRDSMLLSAAKAFTAVVFELTLLGLFGLVLEAFSSPISKICSERCPFACLCAPAQRRSCNAKMHWEGETHVALSYLLSYCRLNLACSILEQT